MLALIHPSEGTAFQVHQVDHHGQRVSVNGQLLAVCHAPHGLTTFGELDKQGRLVHQDRHRAHEVRAHTNTSTPFRGFLEHGAQR